MKHLHQKDGTFPLSDKLHNHLTAVSSGSLKAFKLHHDSEIDVRSLAYFAASIIWRASVYPWKGDGNEVTLGNHYQEQFRLYLLGESEFPECATVIVDVTKSDDRLKQILSDVVTDRPNGYHRHYFLTPGVLFEIAVGQRIPGFVRKFCVLREQMILSSNHEQLISRMYAGMVSEKGHKR